MNVSESVTYYYTIIAVRNDGTEKVVAENQFATTPATDAPLQPIATKPASGKD